MKKLLMLLGLATISAMPLAASAHTDVRIGVALGAPTYSYRVPAYYDHGRVVQRPYCPPRRVVYESYHARPYSHVNYGRPVIVYRNHAGDSHHWRHERGEGHWHR